MLKVFKLIATVFIFALLIRIIAEAPHADAGLVVCLILCGVASVLGVFDIFTHGVKADD